MLMAEKIFDVPMKISMLVYFIHPFWLWIFTYVFEFGIAVIGIARNVSEWSGFFALIFYINYKKLI